LLLTGIAVGLIGLVNLIAFLLTLLKVDVGWSLPSDGFERASLLAVILTLLFAGVVIIAGARAFLKRSSRTWAMIAGLLGQPIGLWVLWILHSRDVRDTFGNDASSHGHAALHGS